MESYYDERLSKNYILTGNKSYVKSYDYKENKIYHIYSNDGSIRIHYNIIININKNVIKLIDSNSDESIKIWNFHTGELINRIRINKIGYMAFAYGIMNIYLLDALIKQ